MTNYKPKQQCKYNKSVYCFPYQMHCETCGWNPEEEQRRLEEIKEQMKEGFIHGKMADYER